MIAQECAKEANRNSKKYFNSEEDRYIENKLPEALSRIVVHRAIKALNNRKAVGPDKTSGEMWKEISTGSQLLRYIS